MNNLFFQCSNSTIDPELLFYLLSNKLELNQVAARRPAKAVAQRLGSIQIFSILQTGIFKLVFANNL